MFVFGFLEIKRWQIEHESSKENKHKCCCIILHNQLQHKPFGGDNFIAFLLQVARAYQIKQSSVEVMYTDTVCICILWI